MGKNYHNKYLKLKEQIDTKMKLQVNVWIQIDFIVINIGLNYYRTNKCIHSRVTV